MSTNTTTCVDVTLDTTAVEVQDEQSLATSKTHSICTTPNREILAEKREYSIVGDAYYASTYSGPTPSWLSDLIDNRVDSAVQNGLTDYDNLVQDVRNAIDSIDVAKNTFVEEVSFHSRVDGIVGTRIDTLNTTYDNKFATIANLDLVESNAAFARATQANDLKVAYEDYTDSRITSVQQAFADADSAIADDITAITLRIGDQEEGLAGTADIVSGIQSFVGIDPESEPPYGVISESSWFVDLDNAVHSPDGHVATALSDLETANNLYADNKALTVENKFSYGSKIILDGKYYEAGFGLDASGVTQVNDGLTEETAFDSEFWVNAERFVLKSPTYPDVSAVFKVTETGIVLGLENTEATRNEPKGTYSGSTQYLKGDIVSYNGSSYIALKDLTGVEPVHGDDWSLLAAAGATPMLYDWEGTLQWPVSTDEAGASTITFNSDFPGNVTIRIEAHDAEGGVRIKFNDADEQILSGPDGEDKWHDFHFDNLVAGTNTLKVWSTTADGGYFKKIKAAFVGATGASGESGSRNSTVLAYSADLGSSTYEDELVNVGTYWASEASTEFVDPVAGDSLVLTNTNPALGWTYIFGYDGTDWAVRAAFTVNGDMIVDGTVTSKALATDIIIGKDATFEGKVELVGSTHKRVSSAIPFGTTNQFIEWFGPVSVSEGQMSEGNAITYLKTDGSAYFGGAIISGALSTSSTTSSLGTSETVEIGPFGSNGGIIAINCSVSMNSSRHYGLYDNQQTIPPAPDAPSCTLTLEEYVSGSWVQRQTASYTGTGYNSTFRWDGEHSTYEGASYQSLSGSFTFTDAKQTTANRTYRLKMTNRTGLNTLGDWNASQRVSINAQE